MSDNHKDITNALRQIGEEGGSSNFAIFLADAIKNFYIQVSGERGQNNFYLESVGNVYLAKENLLNENQIRELENMGWVNSNKEKENYHITWLIQNDAERNKVTDFILQTLERVYGFTQSSNLGIQINLE